MKRITGYLLAGVLLATVATAGPTTEARKGEERYKNDPYAMRALNTNFEEFPDSSLVDFSYLLDPPAGKYGKVYVGQDGHFYFTKNRQRTRFWGVTVAASNVDVPKSRIKEAVDAMSRAGCNLLRLHELDNRGGEQYNLVRRNIIDEAYPNNTNSRAFDAEYRDRVDYWIKCAQDRGMYVYLVVRGYRTFREGDGVPNADKLGRSAKPYAFFNRRLIDLQKEYADEWLIKHVNPYTKQPNGLNPAVALIEIENEDSLFFDAAEWNNLVEPYKTEFQGLWNDWLLKKYKTTEALKQAWTNDKGQCALSAEESLEKKNILLPEMPQRQPENVILADYSDPKKSPVRCNDGARFGVDIQRAYFKEMRDFIRSKGCTVPMTAVVNAGITPDTWSVAKELDFVGENAYQDHPAFEPGSTWVGVSMFSNKNYLAEVGNWSMMNHMTGYKWANVPLVCREWATCWPNKFRVSSVLDIAAYSSLNDYDGLIYFCYDTFGNNKISETFGLQADPLRWGIMGYGAKLFLQGDIKPGKTLVELAYTEDDLYTWGSYYNSLKSLAWTHRVQNALVDPENPSKAEIQIPMMRADTAKKGRWAKPYEDVMKEVRSVDSTGILKAEGGQLFKDTKNGYALINTSTFQAVQGELTPYQTYKCNNLQVISSSSVAAVIAASLDGKPLADSRHFSVKMATVAVNRGERLDAMTTGNSIGKYALVNLGAPPVQTLGVPAEKPTQIILNGQVLAEVFMTNGTWELEFDADKQEVKVFCDTQNTKMKLPFVTAAGWTMQPIPYEYSPAKPTDLKGPDFVYPGFAKYVLLKDHRKVEKKKEPKK